MADYPIMIDPAPTQDWGRKSIDITDYYLRATKFGLGNSFVENRA
jgi:hypothetical protein